MFDTGVYDTFHAILEVYSLSKLLYDAMQVVNVCLRYTDVGYVQSNLFPPCISLPFLIHLLFSEKGRS
jgi:hypothetical protein